MGATHESAEVFRLRNTVELAKRVVFERSTQLEPIRLYMQLSNELEVASLNPNVRELLDEARDLLMKFPEASTNNAISMVQKAREQNDLAAMQEWYKAASDLLSWWQPDFISLEAAKRIKGELEAALNGGGL